MRGEQLRRDIAGVISSESKGPSELPRIVGEHRPSLVPQPRSASTCTARPSTSNLALKLGRTLIRPGPDGGGPDTAYLGHADLSTVSRYAHVAEDELHDAAAALAARAAIPVAA
jgi:hypothetical protein